MSGREALYSKLRQSLGVTGEEASRWREVAERLGATPKGVIPARGQLPDAERVALFCTMAEMVFATVERVPSYDLVPETVAMVLRSKNLPAALKRGEDPRLAALPWERAAHLTVTAGASAGDDLATLSHAAGGIAESGTLVMLSGPDNPTTLNFLADYHIVVVAAADIAGDYETVWERIAERTGKGVLPRTVNMITGPSRSADIEQKLLLGAHGPRSLHIIVVENGSPAG